MCCESLMRNTVPDQTLGEIAISQTVASAHSNAMDNTWFMAIVNDQFEIFNKYCLNIYLYITKFTLPV